MERTYCVEGDCTRQAESYCGDGIVQSATGEQCDDGNRINNDDCDNACKWTRLPECGDGILQPDYEQCDQGQYNGDYIGSPCHANCTLPYCGDGWQDANEECDDGNNLGSDGCSAVCTFENRAAPPPLQGQLIPGTTVQPTLPTLPYDSNNPQQPINPYAPQYYGNIPTPARTPTGPGLVIFLASGAAAGVGLVRRRFLK
jgi:cysteine-rich repeat protein